jgi:iron(III) transport system ATP-binding protein
VNAGLVVTELSASHGRAVVLADVDLVVPDQSLACILGPSGCGKTTLLRAVAGFHRPAFGQIRLHGRLLDEGGLTKVAAQHRRIGYIPQEVALFPHLKVHENVAFGLRRGRRADRVRELLELTDLVEYAERYPHQLSGGQQQRVAIARALAPSPELLLLDEPFSALDASLRGRVRAEIVDLLRATGTTAVLVTHDASEALAFADQITVLEEGRVRQTGDAAWLHDCPADAVVARALGEANLLPAQLTDRSAATPLGRLELHEHASGERSAALSTVLIRPRQLAVSAVGSGAAPGATAARVSRTSFQGEDRRLELEVAGCDQPLIAYSPELFDVGHDVYLTVAGQVHPLG